MSTRTTRWVVTGIAALTVATLGVAAGTTQAVSAAVPAETVTVLPDRTLGTISSLLLGGNGRWAYDNFGGWNPATRAAYPNFIQALTDSAVTSVRYPGGTIANLYHWKQAVGPLGTRVDQVHGSTGEPLDNDFGPDEYGRQSETLGQRGIVMVNFNTGTPQEAADWVEYMTGVVGANLDGGKDWAAVRAANGHPKPYDIPYWEVGNELSSSGQMYWRSGASPVDKTTLYAFGGSTTFTRQRVGKHSDYRDSAAVSSGAADQTFVAKYAPVTSGTAHVFVGEQEWSRTQDLPGAGAAAHVFALDLASGKITFGDGTHGTIPASGAVVTMSYTSGPHPGFGAFYAAMKKANPNVRICAGLNGVAATTSFAQVMGSGHPYDCAQQHAYITASIDTTVDADEYHSRLMLHIADQQNDLQQIRQAIDANAGARAAQIKIAVSEYGQLGNQHPDVNPNYHASLSQGLLMANYLEKFIKLGIPVADKSNLTDFVDEPAPGGSEAVGAPLNAMIAGPGPNYELAPTGLVTAMFNPMAGQTAITSSATDNAPYLLENGQSMQSLTTVASRSANGGLDLLVVNQRPEGDVAATVDPGASHHATAQVSTLNGATILSRNLPGDQRVTIADTTTQVGTASFTYTFPAHSITRIHLAAAG
jgi:alpha-N-arabinofuranosidase